MLRSFGMLLQPLCWRCGDCVIHHERDVREEQHHIYVEQTSNNRVIATHDLYCCLLPQFEALRTCRSGFSDRNSSSSLRGHSLSKYKGHVLFGAIVAGV